MCCIWHRELASPISDCCKIRVWNFGFKLLPRYYLCWKKYKKKFQKVSKLVSKNQSPTAVNFLQIYVLRVSSLYFDHMIILWYYQLLLINKQISYLKRSFSGFSLYFKYLLFSCSMPTLGHYCRKCHLPIVNHCFLSIYDLNVSGSPVTSLDPKRAQTSTFFLIGIHSMQGWKATTRHGVTRKRSTWRLKNIGNL